jgi:hypothetical protein
MRDHGLVYPMFAMVLLTFSVVVRLFKARTASVANGTITPGYFKTYQGGNEPEASARLARIYTYFLSWIVLLALWGAIVLTVAAN